MTAAAGWPHQATRQRYAVSDGNRKPGHVTHSNVRNHESTATEPAPDQMSFNRAGERAQGAGGPRRRAGKRNPSTEK